MDLTKEEKIKRFHSEEILLILFICATDLSNHDSDQLEDFTEAIEGRVEDLFEPDFLLSVDKFLGIKTYMLPDFENLKSTLTGLYASQWHYKLKDPATNSILNDLATKILTDLKISYAEPNSYMENHLEIDWT